MLKEVINYGGELVTYAELEIIANRLASDYFKIVNYRDDHICFRARTAWGEEDKRKAKEIEDALVSAKTILRVFDKEIEKFEREFAEAHNVPLNDDGLVSFYEYGAVGMEFEDMLKAWNAKETAAAKLHKKLAA